MGKEVPETFGMKFGPVDVEIETDRFTIPMCKKIGRAYARVRSTQLDSYKYPQNRNESIEDWEKRIKEAKDKDFYGRKWSENESAVDHAARLAAVPQPGIDMYIDMVNAVLLALYTDKNFVPTPETPVPAGVPQIKEEHLEYVNWKEAKDFLFKVFKEANVVAVEYFPS